MKRSPAPEQDPCAQGSYNHLYSIINPNFLCTQTDNWLQLCIVCSLSVSPVCPSVLAMPKKEDWSKFGAGRVTECSLSEELGDATQILVLLPICHVTWDRIRSLPAFLPAVQITLFFPSWCVSRSAIFRLVCNCEAFVFDMRLDVLSSVIVYILEI